MEQKLYDAASRLPETCLDFDAIQPRPKAKPVSRALRAAAPLAACIILLISIGFLTAEAKEYSDAMELFQEYGLSPQGLSRDQIKAVYRDITTEAFSYHKTFEVITQSLTESQVEGFEFLLIGDPTPEDVQNLWNYKNFQGGFLSPEGQGIHYSYRAEYKMDPQLGFEVHHMSYLEKFDGDTLLWSVPIPGFEIQNLAEVSGGVIAYGDTPTWSSTQNRYPWMAKVDAQGNLLWTRTTDHGFQHEYIAEILENPDGSYAVISRGDLEYFCLSQYTASGKETHFRKTQVGNYGIWNAVRLGDGYLVQLGSYMTNEHARIVKVDREGNITESFSYGSGDAWYFITDMIEYNGNIYLSAYAVPKDGEETQNGRYEINPILEYLFDNGIWEISSEELTPMVRDLYTALLLVCDPNSGTPQEFYSTKGSLGGKLSQGEDGNLLWDTESITTTFFSPATSSFTIGGTCQVYRYAFGSDGTLIRMEKTDEMTNYRR